MSLSSRMLATISTNRTIETRSSGQPLASLFLRVFDRSSGDTRYELSRGLYHGYVVSHFIVLRSGERIDLKDLYSRSKVGA